MTNVLSLQDAIATDAELGMSTTVGSCALQDARPLTSPLTAKVVLCKAERREILLIESSCTS